MSFLRSAGLGAVVASLLLPVAPAGSAAPPLDLQCGAYGGVTTCSGLVPSFDGAPLDVDLTLPPAGGRHPLVVMLHGFGNNKHEWESTTDAADGGDKWQWNSHWFATHGFYVLTYTARGFRDSGPSRPDQPATPSYSSASPPSGTIHLKSRDFEARDTMWLASLAALAHPDLDRERVAVTGGSYGGGESWLLASEPVWSVAPGLPVLRLQVAVPKYPWTDLAYSLAPSGHPGVEPGNPLYSSAAGRPSDPAGRGEPLGVPKASYVGGFYALGNANGIFEAGTTTTPSEEGPIDVHAWNARIMGTGDPYDVDGSEDPVIVQARRGLTVFRSAYYQAGWERQPPGQRAAIYSISGWTDHLFPAIESFRMFQRLKSIDPAWPVWVAAADVGHPPAANPASQWQQLNTGAWEFLAANLDGRRPPASLVTSLPATCASGQDSEASAGSPEALAAGRARVEYAAGGATTSAGGAGDPNGPATDPVAGGGGCRTSPGPAAGGYTGLSQPLSAPLTMLGIGSVKVDYRLAGTVASVDVRVWDVDPAGRAVLVTRGAYRVDAPAYDEATGSIRVPLFGNHWPFAAGHRIRLDIVQTDSPTFRPSTTPSALEFGPPVLEFPTREPGDTGLPGQ